MVDPRTYDWKADTTGRGQGGRGGGISKKRRFLNAKPARWSVDAHGDVVSDLERNASDGSFVDTLVWEVKDKLIFPRRWEYARRWLGEL